jgi:hypothetical protein
MTHTTSVNRHRFDAEESRQALLIHRFCPHPKLLKSRNSAMWERAGSRGLSRRSQPPIMANRAVAGRPPDVTTDADAIQVAAD